jgi:nitroreductase
MKIAHYASGARRRAPAAALPGGDSPADRLRALVGYAAMAPSSHNTQPWRFHVRGDGVDLLADFGRWLRVADDDRRELYLSIGCALENLLVAAEHFGYAHEVRRFPDPAREELVAAVRLVPGGAPSPLRPAGLFAAIPLRHTSRLPFTRDHVSDVALRRLAEAGEEEGIRLVLSRDPAARRRVESLVSRADALEYADPAFRAELAGWIGRGALGTPWPLSRIAGAAVRHLNMGDRMAKRDAALVSSAPVLGLVLTERDDREARLRAGQAAERVWLTAASFGLALQPLSAPLQVPGLREEMAELAEIPGWHLQHAFRLGVPEGKERHAPRRPVEELME